MASNVNGTPASNFVTLRYGWKRALMVGLLVMPILAVAVAGRQTDIDLNNSDDTAVGRMRLWRDGLVYFPTRANSS